MTARAPDPARLSRRTLTGGGLLGLAAAVAGCTEAEHAAPSPRADTTQAPADADEQLLLDALDAETALRARIERAVRRHRRLRGPLSGALDVHTRHVDLLQTAVVPVTREGPTPSAADGARAGSRGPRGSAADEQAALAGAERALADRHARGALAAASGQVARLLAALSAAAAQQGQALATDVPAGGRP